jgi:hypothetical protein
MSGDLEDFLRRAGQRRQAKADQQQQPPQRQPAQRQPPQYSDRRTERVAKIPEDEVLTAGIVEDDPNSFAARLQRKEEAKRAAKQVEAEAAAKLKKSHGGRARSSLVSAAPSGHPAQDLIRLLQQPGGIQQAILLREILDRPEHRW